MTEPPRDQISQTDLPRVLRLASELQARTADTDGLPLSEAERIAKEVGIDAPAFRAAVAAVRATDTERTGTLGPSGLIAASASLRGEVRGVDAVHMLAEAQLGLPEIAAPIETPADGIWRVSNRGSWVQISSRRGSTTLSAGSDRRYTRLGLVGGGAAVGAMAGSAILTTLAVAFAGSIEAVAVSQVVGLVGGAAGGLSAGVRIWRKAAGDTYQRVLHALDRMRAVEVSPATRLESED